MGTQNAPSGPGAPGTKQYLNIGEAAMPNSSFTHKSIRQLRDLLQTASLLGRMSLFNLNLDGSIFFRLESVDHWFR